MAGTAVLGHVLGLGAASLLAGIAAVMCVIAAFGGTLAGDLRFFVVFGPVMVGVVAGPRLLSAVSPLAAMAVVAVVVFVAGVLPGFGRRYQAVALAVGLGVVFGYAYPLPDTVSWPQLVGAPVVAVVVAVVIRIAAGARDPRRPVREALVAVLTDAKHDSVDEAIRLLQQDTPRRWTVDVFAAALTYRAKAAMMRVRESRPADVSAEHGTPDVVTAVAAMTLARRPAVLDAEELTSGDQAVSASMLISLRVLAATASNRDETPYPVPAEWRRWAGTGRWRSVISWRSEQFRHALRITAAMVVVLALSSLEPADPLKVTLLAVTFGIVQPAWRATVTKLRQRFLGVLVGVVLLAVVVGLAPEPWLLPIGLASLLVGLAFISSRPAVYYAASVLLSVGTKAATSGLDPVALLVEYPLLVVLAAAVGLVFGFVAVPWMRPPGVAELLTTAEARTADLLRAVTQSNVRSVPDTARLGALLGAADLARRNLVLARPIPGPGEDDRARAIDHVSEGLRGLAASAAALHVGDHPPRGVPCGDGPMSTGGDVDEVVETVRASMALIRTGARTLGA